MRKQLRKLKSIFLKHTIMNLRIDGKTIKISIGNLSAFGEKYLLLKDRNSGRRLQFKTEKNKEVIIPIDELIEVNKDGVFDIYLKNILFGKILKKRTKFSPNLKIINYLDRENKTLVKTLRTKKDNFSVVLNSLEFNVMTNSIELTDKGFMIKGIIEDFEGKSPNNGEVLVIRRDTKSVFPFPLILEKNQDNNVYSFCVNVNLNELKDELAINSRWDIVLHLFDSENQTIYRGLFNLQSYKDFSKEEDRYIKEFIHDDEYVTSIYATEGKQSLALWYTDKGQFSKTYSISKGKTIFNEVSLREKLNEKMIFFESFLGKNYSGNPKYIYETMLKHPKFKDFTFVWSYSGTDKNVIPGNPIIVTRDSEDYYKYLAMSKYWVSNILFPIHKKREGNVYIQTWHGTPLKKLGWDIEIEGPETLARENFYIESRNWDYLISANKYSTDIFRRAFKFNKTMLEVGYPANDIFYQEDLDEKVINLKKALNIPRNKKVILYAPTWRDNEMVGSWEHKFELKFNLENFYNKFKDNYVLILRMHHLISENIHLDQKYSTFIYDFSRYDDIQELYTVSDILITDYSSVFFDYANSRRPILYYAYDYEEYKDNIRGFYLNMETDLPGPILKTEDELINAIENIDLVVEKYKHKYDEFYNKFCYLDDGNAGKRVIQEVFGK